jgi:hypothetical protein
MTTIDREDIVLPPRAGDGDDLSRSNPIAAFVPIALALFGVGLILFGGVRAIDPASEAGASMVDPIVTGAVTPPGDHLHDL